MSTLRYALNKHPVIASMTDLKDMDKALHADSSIIILMHADIRSLESVAEKIKETNKLIFVHIDLMKGLKRDVSGIHFLADHIGIDGIVTTQANLIRIARRINLLTIQRVFILDSASIKQGVRSVKESNPDAVEILPGIAVPHIKESIKKNFNKLVIAGGLINTEDEIVYILKNGAEGISSSAVDLWKADERIKEQLKK